MISLLISVSRMLSAQDTTIAIKLVPTHHANDSYADSAKIYFAVDQMPNFPGGEDSMMVGRGVFNDGLLGIKPRH